MELNQVCHVSVYREMWSMKCNVSVWERYGQSGMSCQCFQCVVNEVCHVSVCSVCMVSRVCHINVYRGMWSMRCVMSMFVRDMVNQICHVSVWWRCDDL